MLYGPWSATHVNSTKSENAMVPCENVIRRDDVVSQRLKFDSAFHSSSLESKIALFF